MSSFRSELFYSVLFNWQGRPQRPAQTALSIDSPNCLIPVRWPLYFFCINAAHYQQQFLSSPFATNRFEYNVNIDNEVNSYICNRLLAVVMAKSMV